MPQRDLGGGVVVVLPLLRWRAVNSVGVVVGGWCAAKSALLPTVWWWWWW